VAKATIDRDQLAALRALRRAFGPERVKVIEVVAEPPGSRGPDRAPKRR
jgi:hypothetical protein